MRIGIAYDLKTDFQKQVHDPEDRFEEYDSEATVQGIARALATHGHTPVLLGGGRRLVEALLNNPPELVFNIAEGFGTRSREAHVPALCEMLRVPFTHSDPLTLAVTLDKAIAKRLAVANGVPTPDFVVIERESDLDRVALSFPVITKPLSEGSSMGIRRTSRVTDRDRLRRQIGELLAAYQQPVLVEEFCPGAEFTVAVVGNGKDARVIGVMEIVPKADKLEDFVYSLEVKRNYLEEVEYRVPPNRPRKTIEQAEQVALLAYHALECRDVARIDLRVGTDGEPKFIEVNPLPGLNPISSDIVILAKQAGWTFEKLIGAIVSAARSRLEM